MAAKTVFPIDGGSGDAGFADHCPANEFLTGLAGRSGGWVDRIQIICAPMLANGTQGPSSYGPLHGGTGGAALEFSCASDSVVTGVQIFLDDKDSRVTRVDLACTGIQSNHQATVAFGAGGVLETLNLHESEACPNGELAVGLAGRYGKDVNALGLLCDARTAAAAALPAPVRRLSNAGDPIRLTGKAATAPSSAGGSCPSGFVWREASPTDHVCVSPVERRFAASENAVAAEHVSSTDTTYGPNTCAAGYVWREAYAGDIVCVTPRQRARTAKENSVAPALIPAN